LSGPRPSATPLVVLVADRHMEAAVAALLEYRATDIGCRLDTFRIHAHPEHDPGVYGKAAEFLRPFLSQCDHALVLLDAQGCGARPGRDIQAKVQHDLDRNGWKGKGKAVVICPELEAWVWARGCRNVARVLRTRWPRIRQIATPAYWAEDAPKPSRPKELLETVCRQARIVRNASVYAAIAGGIRLAPCEDGAFAELCATLRSWFPA
jgi:hypothetical protein